MNREPHVDSNQEKPSWEALARYLAGEASVDEGMRLRQWLEAHPDDAAVVQALGQTIKPLAGAPARDIDVEAALRRVTARRVAESETPVLPLTRRGRGRVTWYAGLAAAAVLAVVAAIGLLRNLSTREAVSPAVATQNFQTIVGQRDSVRLVDGTQVLLGPSSHLTVAAGYGAQHRQVTLQGEAYFVVVHDANRVFTVQTSGAVVQDVGTAFNVRNDGAGRVIVAVTEGSVLLRAAANDAGVFLQPGDRGEVLRGARASAQRGGALEQDTAWTRGRLVFRESPLADVQTTLRRWYGVELRVQDTTLARQHLTATFEREPVAEVLRVIGLTLGATVERRGDTAVVRRVPARMPSR